MGKVKVGTKLFKDLNDYLQMFKDKGHSEESAKSILLTEKTKGNILGNAISSLLVMQLAEILVCGYELELTKEEKILNLYNDHIKSNKEYDLGYINGVYETLENLKLRIEGINK